MTTDRAARVSIALQELASGINEYFKVVAGGPVAFVLVVSIDNTAQYISNSDRKDGEELLESLLDRWKANRADIPAHYNPDLKE
jgi:hypothetical protein